jgi:hypothetical protein
LVTEQFTHPVHQPRTVSTDQSRASTRGSRSPGIVRRNQEGVIAMSIFRIFLTVAATFLAGLYVYDACRGVGIPMVAATNDIVARRWPEPDEFRPSTNPVSATAAATTPAARVRETFAMFNPGDARRRTTQRSL